MLSVADSTKELFLKDSCNKDLLISFTDVSADVAGTNFFSNSQDVNSELTIAPSSCAFNFTPDGKNVINDYTNLSGYYAYVSLSFDIYIEHESDENITDLNFQIGYTQTDGTAKTLANRYSASAISATSSTNMLNLWYRFPSTSNTNLVFTIWNTTSATFNGKLHILNYSVNYGQTMELLPYAYAEYSSTTVQKIIDQLDEQTENITNENIVTESMELTESLCSADNLKLGACESAVFKFSTVGRTDNFIGKTIYPYICVDNPDPDLIKQVNFYNESLPKPNVPRRINTNTLGNGYLMLFILISNYAYKNYIKDTQYLRITYKFKDLNISIDGYTDLNIMSAIVWQGIDANGNKKGFHYIDKDYNSVFRYSDVAGTTDWVEAHSTMDISKEYIIDGIAYKVNVITQVLFYIYDDAGNAITQDGTYSLYTENVQINIIDNAGDAVPAYDSRDCIEYYGGSIDDYVNSNGRIPLGKFVIKDVKTEHVRNLCKKTITAYDPLYKMSQNAMNWYTSYMWAMSTSAYSDRYDFEYVRQIYSTYFNMAKRHGYENLNTLEEAKVTTLTYSSSYDFLYPFHVNSTQTDDWYLRYNSITIDVDDSYLYRLGNVVYMNNMTEEEAIAEFPALAWYGTYHDSLYRGALSKGTGLITEYDSTGAQLRKYVVDVGDYFALTEGCTSIRVAYPTAYWNHAKNAITYFCKSVSIYSLDKTVNLKNRSKRLLYYKYYQPTGAEDIFDCDSSITVRDVIRSILELTGCFYNLDRYGDAQFIYCTKTALYPSETLYPADALYPRGTLNRLPMGKYTSFEAEEYAVKDIGKIQILKNSETNSGSVCEWEYVGDSTKENTYVIDDNIFLCNMNMIYEPDMMGELSATLEDMYSAISNMSYVPNTTTALGEPWLEVGDRVTLLTETSGSESFIFRRTLSGIQLLKDVYEAVGDEITEAIDTYDY